MNIERTRTLRRALAMLAVVTMTLPTLPQTALSLEQVQMKDAAAGRAFTVVDTDNRVDIDLADLSSLPHYKLQTDSPWEEGQQTFEGVLFRDVLKLLNLSDAEAVIVRAKDDYSQRIPREDWLNYPTLLALRADGKTLTRRDQGPTRLVYPVLEHPELNNPVHKNRWVWLIESVERAD